jgi:hypothetical protein
VIAAIAIGLLLAVEIGKGIRNLVIRHTQNAKKTEK